MDHKKNNLELRNKYDEIYRSGAYQNFFSVFNPFSIHRMILDALSDWRGKDVVDIGCGQGELSAQIAFAGAKSVLGIDYSEKAIEICKGSIRLPNLEYRCVDANVLCGDFDVIVMAGVLEHTDDPWTFLDLILSRNLRLNGAVISVSPSFMNPRGYVWMALQMLVGVPMTKTDLVFFSPKDFQSYADSRNLSLELTTFDQEWGAGDRLISDFQKRLPNALRDRGLDTNGVEIFLDWLEGSTQYFSRNEMSGALMVCKLTSK